MIDMGLVTGSEAQAKPLIFGVDTVYVHTNINRIDQLNGIKVENIYEYNEIQYNINEYMELVYEKNIILENQLADIELALVNFFETTTNSEVNHESNN